MPLSVGKEPELGFQQAPPLGLGETLEASQPLGVSSVVGLSTGEGCWAASRKRWMVREQHSPLHLLGCSVVCSSFPLPVCEEDVFHSRLCGLGVLRCHVREAGVGLVQVRPLSGEKA